MPERLTHLPRVTEQQKLFLALLFQWFVHYFVVSKTGWRVFSEQTRENNSKVRGTSIKTKSCVVYKPQFEPRTMEGYQKGGGGAVELPWRHVAELWQCRDTLSSLSSFHVFGTHSHYLANKHHRNPSLLRLLHTSGHSSRCGVLS